MLPTHERGEAGVWRRARHVPGSKLDDVLRSYPRTGSVFLQTARFFVDQPKSLYAHYPEETIAEYAERNGIDLESLLRRLNAEAEASAWEASRTSSQSRPRRAPEGAIGYTGAYVEFEGSNIEAEPIVARQSARGLYRSPMTSQIPQL